MKRPTSCAGLSWALTPTGVDEILIMPDYYGLGQRAPDGIGRKELNTKVSVIDMPISHTSEDSTGAEEHIGEQDLNPSTKTLTVE